MITLNNSKLKELFDEYKAQFNTSIPDEIYKWQVLKQFQDNWNVDAVDFEGMLSTALSKTYNLLDSQHVYPKAMLLDFCKIDVDKVRSMFRNLYDESIDLYVRICEFIKSSEELFTRTGLDKKKSHFQNLSAISVYLWLRHPEKYYILKYWYVRDTAALLGSDFIPKMGVNKESIEGSLEFLDIITEYIVKDGEFQEILSNAKDNECAADPGMHTAVIDFIFYLSKRRPDSVKTKGPHYWTYSPGEDACHWNDCLKDSVMYLGWDPLGNLTQYASRDDMKDKIHEAYDSTGSCKNDTLALWNFVHDMKPGDIIFAKKGRTEIIGRGIVTGEYYYDENRKTYCNARSVEWINTGSWISEDMHALKTLTDITEYKEYVESLESLFKSEPHQYWWLTANPKRWNPRSDWAVGEEEEYTLYNEKGNKRRIFQHFLDAKLGDKIICYEAKPSMQVIATAEISRESDGDTIGFTKIRDLDNPIDFSVLKSIPELQDMEFFKNPNGSFFKLTKLEYDTLMGLINQVKIIEKYTEKDFLQDVFMTKNDLHSLESLLRYKKNIILQGAPGVGKTFSAKRLAYKMMGEKDDNRICYVQFHQNYSYEDFIMGYKPVEEGFKLREGLFYEFCAKASKNTDKEFFFIIDEINRGNLSKIFGELLMLIEKSYRGTHVRLAYNGELFTVPKNIYIIGMMNTADRSLAMMDYALRRRFSFYKMTPGFDSDGFKGLLNKVNDVRFERLINEVKALNLAICDDASLGEGFQIGHSYFCDRGDQPIDEWLQTIVNYDLIPMLEEYWFDNDAEVKNWSSRLLKALND